MTAVESAKPIRIYYVNWRGESRWRTILPERIWWGSNEWHKESQWLLDATDLEDPGPEFPRKTFSLLGIKAILADTREKQE